MVDTPTEIAEPEVTAVLPSPTRPRGGEWLADDIFDAANEKIDTIVSMLTAPENAELGLLDERRVVEAAKLQFFSVPVARCADQRRSHGDRAL
jgi:hypothetical protein